VYPSRRRHRPSTCYGLDSSLADLVVEHRPDSVAVERVFSQHNVGP
jgi:crossover junction endodeoxyribonuclease RuvC